MDCGDWNETWGSPCLQQVFDPIIAAVRSWPWISDIVVCHNVLRVTAASLMLPLHSATKQLDNAPIVGVQKGTSAICTPSFQCLQIQAFSVSKVIARKGRRIDRLLWNEAVMTSSSRRQEDLIQG